MQNMQLERQYYPQKTIMFSYISAIFCNVSLTSGCEETKKKRVKEHTNKSVSERLCKIPNWGSPKRPSLHHASQSFATTCLWLVGVRRKKTSERTNKYKRITDIMRNMQLGSWYNQKDSLHHIFGHVSTTYCEQKMKNKSCSISRDLNIQPAVNIMTPNIWILILATCNQLEIKY